MAEPESKTGAMETFRAVPEGAKEIPVMTAPGVVEGRIDQPGQAHVIHLKVEKPQDTGHRSSNTRSHFAAFQSGSAAHRTRRP